MEGIPTDPFQLFKIFLLVSIQWSIPIIFATRVIKKVRIKSAGTPNEIIKILWRYLAVFFLVWILVPRVAYLAKLTPPDTTYYANLFQNLIIAAIILGIYSTIWVQYFRKSKRVLAYYGKNAGGVRT
jgi:uncharacterized membrane protein